MTAHSLLGASGAYRWLACPGSFKLSQTTKHRPASIYAARGTLAHTCIEQAFQSQRMTLDADAIGETEIIDGHTVVVDDELASGVNLMLAYLRHTAKPYIKVEFQVTLDDYFPVPPPVPLFGTVDAALLDEKCLEIVDYKNGAGVVVSPVENPQLLFYAAGVLRDVPPVDRDAIDRIKMTIVQPNAPGLEPIRSWEIAPLDLLMWVDDVLVPGVEACTQPDAPFNAGTWCRFCPVAHACPLLHQSAVTAAQAEFDDADAPWDKNDLADMLNTAERAQLWAARVQEFALDQLKSQVRIPGWGLVPTRPMRKWLDERDAERVLGEHLDDIWERKLRSPAQIEKRFGPSVRPYLAPLTESVSSGVKLARTNDAGEDFNDGSE